MLDRLMEIKSLIIHGEHILLGFIVLKYFFKKNYSLLLSDLLFIISTLSLSPSLSLSLLLSDSDFNSLSA